MKTEEEIKQKKAILKSIIENEEDITLSAQGKSRIQAKITILDWVLGNVENLRRKDK